MDNNARTPIERLRELGEQLWDDGLDTAACIMSECLSQIETELAAANETLARKCRCLFDSEGKQQIQCEHHQEQQAKLTAVESKLAAANEQRKVAEKESADSEQLRYEENRKVCEWMDRALAAESKLEAARAEQIERDAKICDEQRTLCLAEAQRGNAQAAYSSLILELLAKAIRAQMDTTHKD